MVGGASSVGWGCWGACRSALETTRCSHIALYDADHALMYRTHTWMVRVLACTTKQLLRSGRGRAAAPASGRRPQGGVEAGQPAALQRTNAAIVGIQWQVLGVWSCGQTAGVEKLGDWSPKTQEEYCNWALTFQ
jgi:hypothetical protein